MPDPTIRLPAPLDALYADDGYDEAIDHGICRLGLLFTVAGVAGLAGAAAGGFAVAWWIYQAVTR